MTTADLPPFEFLDYNFDKKSLRATFRYRGGTAKNPLIFEKNVDFSDRARNFKNSASKHKNSPSQNSSVNCHDFSPEKLELLNRALFLSFIINGTSYYKAFPSKTVKLKFALDDFQADFFNHVYQEGLSQFAYENHLTRDDLAHFVATESGKKSKSERDSESFPKNAKIIALQSGGKDSLLTATLLNESGQNWSALYVSTTDDYPQIIDDLGAEYVDVIRRDIDLDTLIAAEKLGGRNGHVPVTYINMSLALIQAIIDDRNLILTSIGREGEELHSVIRSEDSVEPDLPVNHQWSKTAEAENLFRKYLHNYISPEIDVYSPLRNYSELKIAELFSKKCWDKFGHKFSSCNRANYLQKQQNANLKWCGNCAKCANSYLLFAQFIPAAEQNSLFENFDAKNPNQNSLFLRDDLTEIFKGLLGVDGELKPFECVGEVAELRSAYAQKLPDYPDLPVEIK